MTFRGDFGIALADGLIIDLIGFLTPLATSTAGAFGGSGVTSLGGSNELLKLVMVLIMSFSLRWRSSF